MSADSHKKALPGPFPDILLSSRTINLIVLVVGVAAAYFMTIQSLRLDLAAKAETAVVETLDRRLTAFEVLLKQGVVDKEQFYRFSRDIETRLIRIEQYLTETSGDSLGTP